MTPEDRYKRMQEFRTAMALHDVKRMTTSWEDEKESVLLAYDIFGLTSKASWNDVRTAYREMAVKHHPDKGGDPRCFRCIRKRTKSSNRGIYKRGRFQRWEPAFHFYSYTPLPPSGNRTSPAP